MMGFFKSNEGVSRLTKLDPRNTFEAMKAVEGWALRCYQESVKKSPNNEEIIENLKKINLQVRKLWARDLRVDQRIRRGSNLSAIPRPQVFYEGPSGNIPESVKNKLTQIRAAAVVTLRDIKKDKQLSNGSKRNIRMLSSLATEVVKLWNRRGTYSPSGKTF